MLPFILAQAALPAAVPEWIPPVLLVNGALAVIVIVANVRGYWVSGREYRAMQDAKDKEIASLKATFQSRLDYVEDRRQEERDARISDARVIGILSHAGNQATRVMQAVSDDLGPDPYADRQRPRGGDG